MTVVAVNLAPDNTTDTTFRSWGKPVSDAFTSFGIIKTNDTGQIDWSTVIKPAANAVAGYEMRQFTDSLQATAPLFFKIEYGADASSRPQIWIQFGRGSNGTGGLTGVTTTRQAINTAAGGITTPFPCILSGSTNRFLIVLWFTLANGVIFVSCERMKDISGNDTAEGAMITFFANGIRLNQRYPFSGFVPPTQDLGVHLPLGVTSGVDGADVNYYPNFFYRNGTPLNPGVNHLAYFSGDVTAYDQAPISVYGTNRNYYFLGTTTPVNAFSRGGTLGVSLAILYE